MKKKICVDLIDDDEAVLDALGLYLESKGIEVRRHENANAFLKARRILPASECIVCDIRMPGMTGLELQKALNRNGETSELILITGFADVDIAVSAMKAGAFDFIEKPVDESRLVASIRAAANKAERVQADAEELARLADRLATLTDREQEVLELVTRGMTNRDIAAALGISPRTVEVHRASMMQKSGVDSLADLVRIAMRLEMAGASPRGRKARKAAS